VIGAGDFAGSTGPRSSRSCSKFGFGIDRKKAAAKLREIADVLEGPHELSDPKEPTRLTPFVLQEIALKQTVSHEDFTISELTLRYAELQPQWEPEAKP
jgi:hypothetical protein